VGTGERGLGVSVGTGERDVVVDDVTVGDLVVLSVCGSEVTGDGDLVSDFCCSGVLG